MEVLSRHILLNIVINVLNEYLTSAEMYLILWNSGFQL